MDTVALTALKKDFAEWSGGFPPDSLEQITVYIDYTLPVGTNPDEARQSLIGWMDQEAMVPPRSAKA